MYHLSPHLAIDICFQWFWVSVAIHNQEEQENDIY